ncbi:hypothetical protein OAF98_05535 [Planctomicrobium sp.]|nr:hypothetical protein [Planctomicrobium sp.]MDA7503829.1 hypothetical protein [bacterium]MDB4439715.1 hypothetical protein [Planctomicrobium sp.]MDB4743929.1 hypothetical protein [Planctomicrobium sp.]MDB4802644.1 hypothetical protein [bacterium]
MSDIIIFMVGCGVMGVVLAATCIATIAGSDSSSSETTATDLKK